jgi:hypothetical protein
LAQSDVPMAKPESVGMSTERLQRIHKFMQEHQPDRGLRDADRAKRQGGAFRRAGLAI